MCFNAPRGALEEKLKCSSDSHKLQEKTASKGRDFIALRKSDAKELAEEFNRHEAECLGNPLL